MKKIFYLLPLLAIGACHNPQGEDQTRLDDPLEITAQEFGGDSLYQFGEQKFVDFNLKVNEAGRYKVELMAKGGDSAKLWVEDYIQNTDDRSYNITGMLRPSGQMALSTIVGSPLDTGTHPMRLHLAQGTASIKSLKFTLVKKLQETPNFHKQNMEGEDWELVWSDEFDGSGLPDTTKWSYNIGNWGWGNNEPQFYTENRIENARQENGNLIIEAHKNDMGQAWTSARLSTQGKHAFTYGKIEFRAKVPAGRGTWAAGWLLGDAYRDEISWPYCGEIDVLETVGYEIDDSTGSGLNHATCHTRAYYFKQGNQIGSEIEIDSMDTKFHTYAIQWYPDRIEAYLDGEYYFTYDKNANDLEWPFHNPQNIIINLAVGGGWGGAQGIDPSFEKHQYILDYVRVYQAKASE